MNKVNERCQEFHYATPSTKIKINNCFNSSFYGSHLWDLFSIEAENSIVHTQKYPPVLYRAIHNTFKLLYAEGLQSLLTKLIAPTKR